MVEDWKARHPRPGGGGRLLLYIILLVAVILAMTNGKSAIEGFARIFMGAEEQTSEEVQR